MQAGDRTEPNWASDTNSAKRRQAAPTEILLPAARSRQAGCPAAGVDQHVRPGAYAEDRSGGRFESADANLSSRQLKAIKEKALAKGALESKSMSVMPPLRTGRASDRLTQAAPIEPGHGGRSSINTARRVNASRACGGEIPAEHLTFASSQLRASLEILADRACIMQPSGVRSKARPLRLFL